MRRNCPFTTMVWGHCKGSVFGRSQIYMQFTIEHMADIYAHSVHERNWHLYWLTLVRGERFPIWIFILQVNLHLIIGSMRHTCNRRFWQGVLCHVTPCIMHSEWCLAKPVLLINYWEVHNAFTWPLCLSVFRTEVWTLHSWLSVGRGLCAQRPQSSRRLLCLLVFMSFIHFCWMLLHSRTVVLS